MNDLFNLKKVKLVFYENKVSTINRKEKNRKN